MNIQSQPSSLPRRRVHWFQFNQLVVGIRQSRNLMVIVAFLGGASLNAPLRMSAQLTNWTVSASGNGHYYETVVTNGPISWSAASLTATNRGGYLATITSSSENAFVFALAKADTDLWLQSGGNWWGPWLGGVQPAGSPEPSGGWQWITGEPFTYSNWSPGQPNNSGGNENRVEFGGQSTIAGTWNDAGDTTSALVRGFVIEYDTLPQPQPEVLYGEYVSPYPYNLTLSVPRPTNLVAVIDSAGQFRSRLLANIGIENFERYPSNTVPASLHFGTASATISGTYYIGGGITDTNATVNGVFPFSGTNYLNLTSNATITVSFGSPKIAFGFFGSDLETNQLRVSLVTSNKGEIQFRVPVTRPQGSGGAFFFGVIAPGSPFMAVKLANTGTQEDGLGLDDMMIADANQLIPRPMLTIQPSAGEISWNTIANAGYQLQFSTNLVGGAWLPAHAGYYLGTGLSFHTNYLLLPNAPWRFFRVAVTNAMP